MSDNKQQVCVYCQEAVADTEDHVPGQQFFPAPKPSPSALISVPACSICNSKFQPFENYVRSVLMFSDAGVSQAGKKLWSQKLNRTYEKDVGLRKLIAGSLHRVEFETLQGLYAGEGFVIETDWERISVFVEKLVCGLYYFEYREPFPSFAEIRLARKHHGSADDLSGCLSMTRNGQKRWPNIFEYRHNRVRDLPHESLWMFLFYGYIQWVVFTGDPKRHETEESPS